MQKTNSSRKITFLALYLIGILVGLESLYALAQYVFFKQAYQENFVKETRILEATFQNTLKGYGDVVREFSQEIKKKELFTDTKELSNLFEKHYVYGIENEKGKALRISAINWVDKSGIIAVGRFGTLLSKLEFTPDYIEELKRNIGHLIISDPIPEQTPSENSIVNFGMGVDDKEEVYRGFVNIRVDTDSLLSKASLTNEQHDIPVILSDKNGRIIASSILLSAKERGKFDSMSSKTSFSKDNYVFTEDVSISGYPFSLLFGYSIKDFYARFYQYLRPQLIGINIFFFVLISFTYFFHMQKLKKGWSSFKKRINELNKVISQLSNQNHQENMKRMELEEDLESIKSTRREEKKFIRQVNTRVAETTSDLLNVGNILLERAHSQEEFNYNPEEIMAIFKKAYFHACFVCTYSQGSAVDIVAMLGESVKLYSDKIREKKITVNKTVDKNLRTISTDEISLKQVLVNILGRAINNTPSEGKIEINILGKRDSICIEIKNNGYLEESEVSIQEEQGFLDCMFLKWSDLVRLTASLGATFSFQHKAYKGNQFFFSIPYEIIDPPPREENSYTESNVINFSNWERNKNI